MLFQKVEDTKRIESLADLRDALKYFESCYGDNAPLDVVFPDGLPLVSATHITTIWLDGTTTHEVVLSDEIGDETIVENYCQ